MGVFKKNVRALQFSTLTKSSFSSIHIWFKVYRESSALPDILQGELLRSRHVLIGEYITQIVSKTPYKFMRDRVFEWVPARRDSGRRDSGS